MVSSTFDPLGTTSRLCLWLELLLGGAVHIFCTGRNKPEWWRPQRSHRDHSFFCPFQRLTCEPVWSCYSERSYGKFQSFYLGDWRRGHWRRCSLGHCRYLGHWSMEVSRSITWPVFVLVLYSNTRWRNERPVHVLTCFHSFNRRYILVIM